MFKKTSICAILSFALLLCSCTKQEPPQGAVPDTNYDTLSDAEDFTAPEAAPVMTEQYPGCFYGAYTGTDRTYTGLEPLALNEFENADLTPAKEYPTKTIEHSYGAASDRQPHQISIDNQQFFEKGGYDALCLDMHTNEKVVYLTFDCGYENGYTSMILDTLRDKGVKAAFFCTQPEMEGNPEIIARMINEGHIVGNHSVTHPDFSGLSREEMLEEVKGFDDYIREHFGYSSFYFRYPQGKYSEDSLAMLNSMGYRCVFWSLAYADWDLDNQKGADYALQTVMERLHPGAVILLHAVSPDNATALASIIDSIRAEGYSFRMLSEYR